MRSQKCIGLAYGMSPFVFFLSFFLSRYVLPWSVTTDSPALSPITYSPTRIWSFRLAFRLGKWRKCWRNGENVIGDYAWYLLSRCTQAVRHRERERERGRDRERGGESEREEQQTTYWDLGEVHFLATSPECDDACRAACP